MKLEFKLDWQDKSISTHRILHAIWRDFAKSYIFYQLWHPQHFSRLASAVFRSFQQLQLWQIISVWKKNFETTMTMQTFLIISNEQDVWNFFPTTRYWNPKGSIKQLTFIRTTSLLMTVAIKIFVKCFRSACKYCPWSVTQADMKIIY